MFPVEGEVQAFSKVVISGGRFRADLPEKVFRLPQALPALLVSALGPGQSNGGLLLRRPAVL